MAAQLSPKASVFVAQPGTAGGEAEGAGDDTHVAGRSVKEPDDVVAVVREVDVAAVVEGDLAGGRNIR